MIGEDGDYYLNSITGDIFKKTSGTWIKIGNIKGPPFSPFTSKVRAYNSTLGQTLATFCEPIFLPNKDFDDLNEFTVGTLHRFTASKNGYYLITATVGSFTSSTKAWLSLSIYKNGIEHSQSSINCPYPVLSITDLIYLNINDYIQLRGMALNTTNLPLRLGQKCLWLSICNIV